MEHEPAVARIVNAARRRRCSPPARRRHAQRLLPRTQRGRPLTGPAFTHATLRELVEPVQRGSAQSRRWKPSEKPGPPRCRFNRTQALIAWRTELNSGLTWASRMLCRMDRGSPSRCRRDTPSAPVELHAARLERLVVGVDVIGGQERAPVLALGHQRLEREHRSPHRRSGRRHSSSATAMSDWAGGPTVRKRNPPTRRSPHPDAPPSRSLVV